MVPQSPSEQQHPTKPVSSREGSDFWAILAGDVDHEDDGLLGNVTTEDLLAYTDDEAEEGEDLMVGVLGNPQSPYDDLLATIPEEPTTPRTKNSMKTKRAPKRPLSAYNLFFKAFRAQLSSDNSMSFAQLGQEVARQWKQLSASKRTKYEAVARQDSKRYRKEMQAFKAQAAALRDREGNSNDPRPFLNLSSSFPPNMRTGSQVSTTLRSITAAPRHQSFSSDSSSSTNGLPPRPSSDQYQSRQDSREACGVPPPHHYTHRSSGTLRTLGRTNGFLTIKISSTL